MKSDGKGRRDCPVCGLEMMPSKSAVAIPDKPPAFSCRGCGITALGEHVPKLAG